RNIQLREAIENAGEVSLRSIATTSIIAAIGFIPMAISTNAGAEVQKPLATVVIGGVLISVTIASLMLPIAMSYLIALSHSSEKKEKFNRPGEVLRQQDEEKASSKEPSSRTENKKRPGKN
ncbi:MAG: efflux RND transporter permease subunit, partial [Leptospiraceae bacterium]|nr:efflux RND transporter permease subunit [Leptospiraceae bacterium]